MPLQVRCLDCGKMVNANSVHECDGSTINRHDVRAFIQTFLDNNLPGWIVETVSETPRVYRITEITIETVPPPTPPEPEPEPEATPAAGEPATDAADGQ